jgi:23S rRNA (uracil1939-C5)-methyltransferase
MRGELTLLDLEFKGKAEREKPFCPHFGSCGGCAMQDFPYSEQLKAKEAMLARLFPSAERDSIVPSETRFYRNRMDYAFFPGGIGMHSRGTWKHYANVEVCAIFSPKTTELMKRLRDWQETHNIQSYDIVKHDGQLRYAVFREGKRTDERMLVITTTGELEKNVVKDLNERMKGLITSLHTSTLTRTADISLGETKHAAGDEWIHEELLGEKFRILPGSFFQTNTLQAERMFTKLRSIVETIKPKIVWDLYAGMGTIARLIPSEEMHCVEENHDAVKLGKEDCPAHVRFYEGKVEQELITLPDPDLIIVDPPRGGMHPNVLKFLEGVPSPIIYVSCNPNVLAQDILRLSKHKLTKIYPFDLFPHTMHVEVLAVLEPK